MELCIYEKSFFKESAEVQQAIISGVKVLYERIAMYESQNIQFEKIFNDDKVKYDKHGNFYTFKCQKSNMQLRILYCYIFIGEEPVIVIADFFIKKKKSKDYIKKFDMANSWVPNDIYRKSERIFCFE